MIESKIKYHVPVLLLVISLALWGCPKKTEVTSAPESNPSPTETQKEEVTPPAAPSTGNAPTATSEEPNETAGTSQQALKAVYFDFDRALIRKDAKDVLTANAAWLKSHPNVKIRIEGNCDERGTKEYNQALGQRRAVAAKKYLADLGVSGKRVTLISYGKERPVCTESNESCWQKNRRDDFTVRE